jgi:hypothetical protein
VENNVEPDSPQMTMKRMRIASCVTKDTDTLSEYVLLIAFVGLQWSHERVSVLHILPVFFRLTMYSYTMGKKIAYCLQITFQLQLLQLLIITRSTCCTHPSPGIW